MDTLRWLLVVGGVVTLVLVYGNFFLGGRRRRTFSDTRDNAVQSLDEAVTLTNATVDPAVIERALHQREPDRQAAKRQDVAPVEALEPALDYAPESDDLDATAALDWRLSEDESAMASAADEPALTVINVMARPGQVLSGVALANAFEARGYELGDTGLYSLNHEHGGIFSVVNMVEPGQFEPESLHAMTTPGVSFFLVLPGPLRDDVAYDMMVAEAYEVSKTVGADLRDENHAPVTRTHLEETRSRLIRSANARFGDVGGQLTT